MSEFLDLMCQAVAARSRDKDVAVLFSGGMDSLSVTIALEKMGKNIHGYTYVLEKFPSEDLAKAEATARHFGWPLTVITVPGVAAADDFMRLAVEHRAKRKTAFENTYPLLYLFAAVKEAEVWTGWNADMHYRNDRESNFRYGRMAAAGMSYAERKAVFDQDRKEWFAQLEDPDSNQTWGFARRHAGRLGKQLLDPYLSPGVGAFFLRFGHDELSSLRKPLIRKALADELASLPKGSITVGVRLQTGGGVDTLFETLLADPRINRFEKKYTRVSDMCRRWGKEVDRDPGAYEKELAALAPACTRTAPEVATAPAPRPTSNPFDKSKIVEKMLAQGVTVQETARALSMKVAEVQVYVTRTAPPAPPRASKPQPICNGAYHTYNMDEVHEASAARRFSVVSMFAGGGGSSIGYRLAGAQVLLISEFIGEARRTYAANFPDTIIDPRDIRDITADPEGPARFIAGAGLQPGDLDVLDGSPPCSEFSTAGNGIGDQTTLKAYSDTKQRGIAGLIFEFMAVATGTRPKVIVTENVPALRGKYAGILDRALHRLRFPDGDSGARAYYASHTILAADDFGVPQNRRRLFIVGIRADVALAVGITEDQGVAVAFPEPTQSGRTVRQALAGLVQTDHDVRPFRRAAIGTQLGRLIGMFPTDPPRRLGMSDVKPGTKHFKLKRAAWDAPSFTLTCTGSQPDAPSGVLHPVEARKFTLPEIRRLTGLPDDYILTGTLSQAVERVCRMVPPPLTRALADQIYDRILRPYGEARK